MFTDARFASAYCKHLRRVSTPVRQRTVWAAMIAMALAYPCARAGASTADVPPRDTIGAIEKSTRSDGIDDRAFVTIGGLRQWVSVTGRHKDAPILLFLGGGPGLSTIPTAWRYIYPWEEYVTIAQWDQRGTGKTYAANSADALAETMTLPQMVSDAEEVVGYIRGTYGRRKILLLGFSWGSILGEMLAQRHPDWFFAYIGMSQVLNFPESDRRSYEATLADARRAHDVDAVTALEGIAPFPQSPGQGLDVRKFAIYRQQLEAYGGVMWRGKTAEINRLGQLSPDYDQADLDAGAKGLAFSFPHMWPAISRVDLLADTDFALPVVLLQGRHDRIVSGNLVAEWFDRIRAPSKKLVWFEDSAHYVYQEQPATMVATIAGTILPLAAELASSHRRTSGRHAQQGKRTRCR
jgi:pimeloyl-ACP methyl ester carboxylesterase